MIMCPVDEMNVAVSYLFQVLIPKWRATATHEKVELRTVPLGYYFQLM